MALSPKLSYKNSIGGWPRQLALYFVKIELIGLVDMVKSGGILVVGG